MHDLRIRQATLAFLCLPLLFLGCKKAEVPGEGKPVVLRYLTGPDVGGSGKDIIALFQKENPGIRVEMIEGPSATNTRENMYSTSFMAKEATYDLAFMDVIWVPKFASQGWLRPLDDFFTPEMQKELLPGPIDGSRYKGKIYRVPTQADGGMLYYRKDILDAAGLKPPETWDDLVSISKKLQKPPGLWGFVFQGAQYEGVVCDLLELVWGNGGALIDGEGRVRIDEPESVEALKWLVDAVRRPKISPKGVLTYQEEETRHLFQEGKAIFMRNWPYAWTLLQGDKSRVKGKVGIKPMVHGKGKKSASTLGGWGWGISAFSKNPEAAWKYIEFAARPECQKIAYLKSGIMPTLHSLFSDPEIVKTSPHFPQLYKVLLTTRPRPVHPAYARISDILQLHVSSALVGREDPASALKAAAGEIRRVIR